MSDRNGTPPTSGSTPAPVEPQSSEPTTFIGAPHIGTDTPAWDDQPTAWRDALGSAR